MLSDQGQTPRAADVLLADGSVAVIRPITAQDADELHALHRDVSDDSVRLRFFTVGRHAAHEYVDHLVRDHPLALVAERGGKILAVATAEGVDARTAEVAFLVEDGSHGLGIGSLLLEHLAAAARASGIGTFVAEVLIENRAMLDVFTDAGFTLTKRIDDDVVDVRLETASTARGQAVADAKDRRAEARSLNPLLYPHSVALAGVRSDGQGIGRAVLDNIRAGGFTGELFVVHPRVPVIDGITAVATFADLPGPVDLAIIAVPAPHVLSAVTDAAAIGVPTAVVISSGFQELGAEGARLQGELAAFARAHSIRVVGPNCLGLMSNHPEIQLNATFTRVLPPDGGVAVATQSGGVGIVLADLARELGLGIGSLVSLGNKVDVSGNDLLAAWTDDPRVTAAALYLESFGNAPKFARIARRFSERKPLLAVVGGRSDGGRRAGASHTAAAATPAIGVAALFAQAGVIGCDGAEDLAEAALLLTREPLTAGPRVGIVSNAGGMGVLAADAATTCGLVVPELSGATRAQLAAHVLGTSGTSNPVDAGATVSPDDLATMVEVVLESGEVDAVLVEIVATSLTDVDAAAAAVALARARNPRLPVLVVAQGLGGSPLDPCGLTVFGSSVAALRALGRAARYAAWLAERATDVEVDGVGAQPGGLGALLRHRADAAALLTGGAAAHDGWIGAEPAAGLLADSGLQPAGALACGPDAAAALAESVGFPVVIKVADGDVVHRTERGLVRVGLASSDAVAKAVTSFERELGRSNVPVLVQPVASGVEIAVGMVRDPSVGPLVMVGAGGVTTDLLGDRVYLVPPVLPSDVRRALRGLRCWPLLDGFRGSDPVDVDALVEVVVASARLAQEVPLVAELDINPLMVSGSGCALVDVKLRLASPTAPTSDEPRQLRRTI
ncbi:acetate--CoA ligase [Marmoricola sp. URHB0036]|uniref:bifunctional acetate--CoA ligase family protein/GNAT family N-acetyltransferase n=1 Tax=Marmoricola sp. URHB0036 TaxID=1298863 RepID=UPI0018CB6D1C|nr:acetate--CoA ligase [Marmoricola sp. URHB0036]